MADTPKPAVATPEAAAVPPTTSPAAIPAPATQAVNPVSSEAIAAAPPTSPDAPPALPALTTVPKEESAGELPSIPVPSNNGDSGDEGKFKFIIILIVVALIVAAAAIFLLLTDQGRALLGIDQQATVLDTTNTDSLSTEQVVQEVDEVDKIAEDLESDITELETDSAFEEFDEKAEFGVGL